MIKNKLIYLIPLVIISLTLGYSAFSNKLTVSNISSLVRIDKDIRISNLSVNSTSTDVLTNYYEFDYNRLTTSINMPYSDSYIIFDVDVTTYGNIIMGINKITNNNSNINYELLNYNIGEANCSEICNKGASKTIQVKLTYNNYDSNNTNVNIQLEFGFGTFYNINYNSITGNYPKNTIEGMDLVIDFNEEYEELYIVMSGIPLVLNEDYSFSNNRLVIYNVDGNISIDKIKKEIEDRFINSGESIKVSGLTLTSLGSGKYELNGTSTNTTAQFIRLTDVLKGGALNEIIDINHSDILLSKNNPYNLTINIISGDYTVELNESVKITFRDELGNNISNLGYDFYSGYISNRIQSDVYMIGLYFGKKNSTFNHLVFEIVISNYIEEEIFDVSECVSSKLDVLDIHLCPDGLIELDTNSERINSNYYIMIEDDIKIASTVNELKTYYKTVPIKYKVGDIVTINYEFVANLPGVGSVGILNYVLRKKDFSAIESPKIENTVGAKEYLEPIHVTDTLNSDIIGLSIYLVKGLSFNYYQFYLTTKKES